LMARPQHQENIRSPTTSRFWST